MAKKTKDRIEARFGVDSVWVLSPGTKRIRPQPAVWRPRHQRRLHADVDPHPEGVKGLGEGLRFRHFVGPSDFGAFFGFDGVADMKKVDAYFDERIKTDKNLQREVERAASPNRRSATTTG